MTGQTRQKAFGTYEIAKICGVAHTTVSRWLEEGKIPFFQTGGGHKRVWYQDLVHFLKSLNIPIPNDVRARDTDVLKVLIVDDEETIRRYLRRTLRALLPEAEIEEATDGFEAGIKIVTMLPSLILLDLQLPGINGFKICEMIRNNKTVKHTKILAITGQNMEETKNRVLQAGADEFLPKPFGLAEIRETMKRLRLLKPYAKKAPIS